MKTRSLILQVIVITLFLTFVSLASVYAPPPPFILNYRLNVRVLYKEDWTPISGASVSVFEDISGVYEYIGTRVTDSSGFCSFQLDVSGRFRVVVVHNSSYSEEDIDMTSSGIYVEIYLAHDDRGNVVFARCINWLPWTLGIYSFSLILGTFIISYKFDTAWKKGIKYSLLVNTPSVIIGVILCLLL